MASYDRFMIILTTISFFTIFGCNLSTVSSRYEQEKITKTKVNLDMRRIRQTLQPFHSLLTTRDLYRQHYNMLKTQWTCCPLQRNNLFDRRDVYNTVIGTYECYDFIRHNQNQLSNECRENLKLFNPIRGDIPVCDGGLLRNIADQYSFVVQLSNYTEKFCDHAFPPLLIYFNISQIIQCERAIRKELRKNSQDYLTYDTLTRNILDNYVQNLSKYYNCNDLKLLQSEDIKQDVFRNYNFE
ncbi:unnamed protein product [Adineta steineri]|uniref:Uncharacterized protein n=1 Tax=Adineta steineri TaxID=433720 RepID=A0A815P127_9BILA|nr:unnamed protein product [Adineta steineri]CAF4089188.1 unnamed protein product [Adineta steineri]